MAEKPTGKTPGQGPGREWHEGNLGPSAWDTRDSVTRNTGDGRAYVHHGGHPSANERPNTNG